MANLYLLNFLILLNFLSFPTFFSFRNSFIEMSNSLNIKLNPCSDFYKFVCDGFEKKIKVSECYEISNAATRKAEVDLQLEELLKTTKSPPFTNITKCKKYI
ncbi:hypothetical protein Mgra_00000602 [Meloidogyne graminicola]|uniref:Peptidase M13 N-terminal domain-containing protein n=1 Tax=Meloidogyne graminicola TaxID=189291 RepID=A0A8T0A2T5_9BILA|nr:hypothetical protein Mgra_00000602 [Meloidogyne graminicola]